MNIFKNSLIIILLSFSFSAIYDVGETVSQSHQNIAFDVCYGDYESNALKLADFNGALNGGDYQVIFINTAASW
jgi:hypothetical protein|tara:strand:- start:42 stop:263 length:222 start_codon:yes stop_codon:yes gene_type:complete